MCLNSCLKVASTESCPKKGTVLRGISLALCTDVLVNSQVQKGHGTFQLIYPQNSTAIENLIHAAPEGEYPCCCWKKHVRRICILELVFPPSKLLTLR